MYFLPVGQGDATVIQCPDGSLNLYDWGSISARRGPFWATKELRCYLKCSFGDIQNILVTHYNSDHYNLLPQTFPVKNHELTGLKNIYIACTEELMKQKADTFAEWVKTTKAKVEVFRGGKKCGPFEDEKCDIKLEMCSTTKKGLNVQTFVMAANLGGCAGGSKLNVDSIVTKFIFGGLKILLSGDFEGEPQVSTMVEFYNKGDKKDLEETEVYHAAHHGATSKANTKTWLGGIKPKAVVSSGDPWHTYGHPRCHMFDLLLGKDNDMEKCLCEHGAATNPCPRDSSKQDTYSCGQPEIKKEPVKKENPNTHGIYTTTPLKDHMNLIHVASTKEGSWTITIPYTSVPKTKGD